jgi:methanogenic corrinoid protein MtbC1
MTDANPLAAEMLETSAAGYASAANALLQQAAHRGTYSGGAPSEWKAHLTQRILELAAAVRVNEPSLFARRISWLRRAIKARGADESELRSALESLRAALDQELPKELRSTVEQPIQLALDALDAEIEPEVHALDASTPHGKLGLEYLTACLEARTEAAVKLVLDALDGEMTPQDAYTKVLVPAQREIGELWHVGDVSVAEERLVSETTRAVMTLIVNRFAPVADESRTVLAASVAGNAHDIGLRAATDLFKLAAWHAIFLGADMPTADLAEAARTHDAKLIVLSATLTTQINTLAAVIESVRQAAGGSKILVGGLALEGSQELWKQLGADGYAPDIDSVVAVGSRLIADS